MLAFLVTTLAKGLGDAAGMTAGRGIGAGEADRRIEGEALPNEDLRLREIVAGGFIGRARDEGVPGAEGAGEGARIEVLDVERARL